METVDKGNRVSWILSAQPGIPAFFNVEPLPNKLQVAFNNQTPRPSVSLQIYRIQPLKACQKKTSRSALSKAAAAFRILIYS